MALEHKISGEFRSRLEKLSDAGKIGVIIWGVVNREGLLPEMSREEKIRKSREQGQEAITPILRYCEEQGISHLGKSETFGMVYGSLTRAQIYALAEQPYVQGILENQEVTLIR
ncbi:MAG: hypothetical protein Q8Q92_01590 [bacterium]|nr:hypothetical protein [bacterium]